MTAVQDFGAGDLIDVALKDGGSRFFAFTADVVPEIDLSAGRLVIDPPEEVDIRVNGDGDNADDGEAGNSEKGDHE